MLSNIALLIVSAFTLMFANANEVFLFGSPFLGLIALVPVFVLIERSKNARHDILYGVLYSLTVNPLLYFWLSSFQNFSLWALIGISVAYCMYYIPLFILLGSTRYAAVQIKLPVQILIWTCFEFLKSIGPLGFPWGTLASAGAPSLPLIQIADFMGMWGVSLVFSTANVCIAHVLLHYVPRPSHRIARHHCLEGLPRVLPRKHSIPFISHTIHQIPTLFAPVLMLCLSLGYGMIRLAQPLQQRDTLTVHLIQINDDPWKKDNFEHALDKIQILSKRTIAQNGKPDLIVWPETFLRVPYTDGFKGFYQENPDTLPFAEFLMETQSPLLTGIVDYSNDEQGQQFYNSATLFTPQGEQAGIYYKQHLVPMGEFLPWWNTRVFRWFYENVLGLQATWTAGTTSKLLTLNSNEKVIQLGPLICFEDSFADIARSMHALGADILVNVTNNSWAGVQSTLEQHFAAARYRSIETRLPLIRLGNNGLTQSIDPHGRVISQAQALVQTSLVTEVPIYHGQSTFYSRFGNLILWILYGVCMVYVFLFPAQLRVFRT